jgi:hypothetical protein
MRDFSQAVIAAQAPISMECIVVSSDVEPSAAQIAELKWGASGYVPLGVLHPVMFVAYRDSWTQVADDAPISYGKGSFGSYTTSHDERLHDARKIPTYGTWYLIHELISPDNVQARREGAALYAIQRFRCAIHMRDFPAARRYWALALDSDPASVPAYAQLALQSLFLGERVQIDGAAYLNIPQDIRNAVWSSAKQSYSPSDGKWDSEAQSYSHGKPQLSMDLIENAAQAGTLDTTLAGSVPMLSVLYCPVFYPDFDPHPSDYNPEFRIESFLLKNAADKANKAAQQAKDAAEHPSPP